MISQDKLLVANGHMYRLAAVAKQAEIDRLTNNLPRAYFADIDSETSVRWRGGEMCRVVIIARQDECSGLGLKCKALVTCIWGANIHAALLVNAPDAEDTAAW